MKKNTSENNNDIQDFFIYLDKLNVAKKTSNLPILEPMDELMLITLARADASGTPFQVLQAMTCVPHISTTTAHRILKRLRHDGWITLLLDQADNRIKYTLPSKQTHEYLSLHTRSMSKTPIKRIAWFRIFQLYRRTGQNSRQACLWACGSPLPPLGRGADLEL